MKILIIVILMILTIETHAQNGRGSSEKGGSAFHHRHVRKKRQMYHFDKQKSDPLIKDNGTSFWRDRHKRSKNNVDGNGFNLTKQK